MRQRLSSWYDKLPKWVRALVFTAIVFLSISVSTLIITAIVNIFDLTTKYNLALVVLAATGGSLMYYLIYESLS